MINKKIRVLMYTERWTSGGIEAVIMNIYKNIDWNKFNIDILVAQDENKLYDGEISKRGGHKFKILDNPDKSPIIRTIKTVKMYRKKLKQGEYDVIHIHAANGIGFLYAFLARTVGIKKIIIHSHNTDIGKKHRIIKSITHNICKNIFQKVPTIYLSCSDKATKWLYTKKTINSGKVKLINNAIDVDRYDYNELYRNEFRKINNLEGKFVIGHVGRFSEQKNHIFLVNAFESLYEKHKNSRLVLVGEGELKEKIQILVKEKGLEKAVIFFGVTNEVEKCFDGFDVFILPSLYEGNPVVGIEAQASGLPCIFSDTITSNAKITPNVKYLSLNENVEVWRDELLSFKDFKRKSTKKLIIQNGFDIKSLISEIENIYGRIGR